MGGWVGGVTGEVSSENGLLELFFDLGFLGGEFRLDFVCDGLS